MSFAFSVIGINHGHIHMQIEQMILAGCTLKSFHAVEDSLAAEFMQKYPGVPRMATEAEIYADADVRLILGAGIASERAEMGMRAMQAGKDVMVDKPGATSLEQLRRLKQVQAETGRIYSIFYCERFHQRATIKAGELVKAGAIGRVIQTICIGPHKLGLFQRPDWFYEKAKYGGILGDIATHMIDQFLYFTGSDDAEIVAAHVGNANNEEHPELEDFGDILLRSVDGSSTGYIRVDWLTPNGLPTWGDGRLFIQGTDGYIEIRKYIDVAHPTHTAENHLYIVNREGPRYINCNDVPFLYGPQLCHDVLNRTQTAMTQEHCFKATELALIAEEKAVRLFNTTDEGAAWHKKSA